jgi:hypothetical protein
MRRNQVSTAVPSLLFEGGFTVLPASCEHKQRQLASMSWLHHSNLEVKQKRCTPHLLEMCWMID